MVFILFIVVGLITGILAGLLGIGGGVFSVPALYYIFQWIGHPQKEIMHHSIATALAATVFTSAGATWSHYKRGAMIPDIVRLMTPGLLVGSIGGALLAKELSSTFLRIFFGFMALCFAFYFFFPNLPHLKIAKKPNRSLTFLNVVFGFFSSVLGVGSGIFIVPALLGYRVAMNIAVANASAGTLVAAVAGTIAYLIFGWYEGFSTLHTLGYIEVPAFLAVGIFSLLTTSLGTKLAHTVSVPLLQRLFAIALATTGLAMMLGN